MKEFPLMLFGLFAIVGIAGGLDCHECTSQEAPGCLDFYSSDDNDDNLSTCDGKMTHCAKYKTVAKLQDSGFITGNQRVTEVVSRLCTKKPNRSNGCRYVQGSNSFVYECLCSTDNCNGGSIVQSSLIGSLLTTGVTVLLSQLL